MSTPHSADIDRRSADRLGIAVATVVVLVLVVGGLLLPVPIRGRVAEAIGDLVHAPLFGGVSLGVLALLERWRPLRGISMAFAFRSALVVAGVFAFGVLMELTQRSLSRHGSVHDAIANGMGILAAVSWYWSRRIQRHHPEQNWLRRALLVNCGFLLAIAWWRPMVVLRDVAAVQLDFPLLASFESPAELKRFYFRRCQGHLTHDDATEGNYAMEVTYPANGQSGTTMIELKPDWSRMKTLELDVALDASATQNVRFMVKVLDQLARTDHSDTYRREWTLVPGQLQHIRIEREELLAGPDTRELDLNQIRYVDMFVLEPSQTVTLRVDAIRLTID